jgi:hypothetical protein
LRLKQNAILGIAGIRSSVREGLKKRKPAVSAGCLTGMKEITGYEACKQVHLLAILNPANESRGSGYSRSPLSTLRASNANFHNAWYADSKCNHKAKRAPKAMLYFTIIYRDGPAAVGGKVGGMAQGLGDLTCRPAAGTAQLSPGPRRDKLGLKRGVDSSGA